MSLFNFEPLNVVKSFAGENYKIAIYKKYY